MEISVCQIILDKDSQKTSLPAGINPEGKAFSVGIKDKSLSSLDIKLKLTNVQVSRYIQIFPKILNFSGFKHNLWYPIGHYTAEYEECV